MAEPGRTGVRGAGSTRFGGGSATLTGHLGRFWEIQCAREEGKKVRGIWAYKDDRTNLVGVTTLPWNDKNVVDYIDSL